MLDLKVAQTSSLVFEDNTISQSNMTLLVVASLKKHRCEADVRCVFAGIKPATTVYVAFQFRICVNIRFIECHSSVSWNPDALFKLFFSGFPPSRNDRFFGVFIESITLSSIYLLTKLWVKISLERGPGVCFLLGKLFNYDSLTI